MQVSFILHLFFSLPITLNSVFLQVTEREHERMISELNAKHSEELSMIKAELRESLEAAHQAELQQLWVCYCILPMDICCSAGASCKEITVESNLLTRQGFLFCPTSLLYVLRNRRPLSLKLCIKVFLPCLTWSSHR